MLADYEMKIIDVLRKENCLADSLSIPPLLEEEVGVYMVEAAKGCSLLMLFKVLKGGINLAELPKNLRKAVIMKMK